MKNKLLLFLLFLTFSGNQILAKKPNENLFGTNLTIAFYKNLSFTDTIKKSKKSLKSARLNAFLAPPSVIAGSSCGDGVSFVQVNVYANGSSTDEQIEWYASQNATTPLYTGFVYSPSIKTTRTFYVQSKSKSTNDVSIRVPVVASVYLSPASVSISVSPSNSPTNLLCPNTPVTFTANGGGDLFEFSVEGVIVQAMSASRTYTTSSLMNGQTVSVRSRYAKNIDGSMTESAWGTGPIEDNVLTAPLSVSATKAYVNSLKISPEENNLVVGLAGKVDKNSSLLLFLDSKSGGFNMSNYGDVLTGATVKGFNYFNNNPSTFDSYFQADYCLIISTDATESNYFADIVELKSGESVRTSLGSATPSTPGSFFGVNKNNTGATDYNLGFEVEILKSLIGYTSGDIKFFGFTMKDTDETSYSVTNSFLSPEISSNLDYGNLGIDYNLRDPNPVVFSSAGLIPCYSNDFYTINLFEPPVTSSLVQPTCSNPLGTITIGSQNGAEYSIDGTTYQASNTFSGLNPNSYTLYIRKASDGSCSISSISPVVINPAPPVPLVPTAANVVQPTCASPSGTIVITAQFGAEYSLDGIIFRNTNSFSGLPENSYTLYVRNMDDTTCMTMSATTTIINAVPLPPVVPTTASVVQPTCGTPSGTITITSQSGVEYSLDGTTYQASNLFSGLAANDYTLYVRNSGDATCVTMSASTTTIDEAPLPPVTPATASITQPTCAIPSGTITITAQAGIEYSLDGISYQGSNSFSGLAPNDYTLYVRNTGDTSCITPSPSVITINAIPTPPVEPTLASVTQPTCGTPSGTIVITTQTGVEYSLDGSTYQVSNSFPGLTPNNYTLYVRNTGDTTCMTMSSSTTTVNAVPLPPVVPAIASVVQPTCATPSGTITITSQSGVEYSLDGTTYQASNSFSGLAPNDYTLYVRNIADITCVTMSATKTTINVAPLPPVVPVTASITQPTCAIPSGTISITAQGGIEYSLDGVTYQGSNLFSGLAPNNYTLFVRNTGDTSCITMAQSAITINAIPTPPVVPSTSSVVQPTCGTPTGTIVISAQTGVEYSLDGSTYQASNSFPGLTPNNYTLYVRNTGDTTCMTMSSSTTTVNAVPMPPVVPTTASVVQPTCATPSGTITITSQSGVEYSLEGTTYQSSNSFSGLAPNSYTLYVRNLSDITCVTMSASTTTINATPLPPVVPATASITQPTCAIPSGTISITAQAGIEYSLDGVTYQGSNTFSGLAPNNYTLFVRNTGDTSCITMFPSAITINAIPTPPVVPTTSSVIQPTCGTPSGTIAITTQTGVEYSLDGITFQTSNSFSSLAPNNYTLYVRNIGDTTCMNMSSSTTTVNAIPLPPVIPTSASVVQPTCSTPSGTITITSQSGVEYSLDGVIYQGSNSFSGLATNSYTLYVRNITDITCVTLSSTNVIINPIQVIVVPTTASVIQPTCAVPSGTISITTQTGAEYSLDGITYQVSNSFSGLIPNDYTLYVRSVSDNSCANVSSTPTIINPLPTPPIIPTLASVVQPICEVPSGSIVIATQTGVEYSLNGVTFQASNSFSGLVPNDYTLYVRNIADNTCSVQSILKVTIDPLPPLPLVPTVEGIIQPTCLVSTGTIRITAQDDVQYSIGNGYQDSPIFVNLLPGTYPISVRFTSSVFCINTGTVQTINPVPPQIQFEVIGNCDDKDYVLTASPLASSYNPNEVNYQWKDNTGLAVGTNSNILNVSSLIASTSSDVAFPLTYTLTITSVPNGCETTNSVLIETIYCNIQKGISPDGNGSNDNFDLRLLGVKKLEIFDRYGIKVYNQSNYTNQWKGQSDKGNELPSATYYYVIEFNNGKTKTGWIYLIREKQ
ncbi:gliding motility-associated C-terminal domain-containing protein [Flavobacterium sp. WC2429]|uniref:Gliding motility-associated C-terminal domain-containing protein n=2 Tax=unclassified Flavobacterium TaxID=196869 RepID=A0AB39WEP7_9FLAO